jgi:hypothetical protein
MMLENPADESLVCNVPHSTAARPGTQPGSGFTPEYRRRGKTSGA